MAARAVLQARPGGLGGHAYAVGGDTLGVLARKADELQVVFASGAAAHEGWVDAKHLIRLAPP